MTALTPDCDPDMSVTGAPFGAVPRSGPRLMSGAVLLVVVAVAGLLVATGAPVLLAVPAVAAGLLCATALVRRGLRVAHRAGSAAVAGLVREGAPATTP